MSKKDFFLKGVKDGIPIALAYFAVSFSFGMMAKSFGINIFEATVMSLVNLTSAGQFAAIEVIGAGGTYLELILTQIVINSRYALMSISLSQKFDLKEPLIYRLLAAFGITDEIFAISASQDAKVSSFYNFGAMSVAIPGWAIGTLLGALLGNILPNRVVAALSVALYGMFIGIIIPPAKKNFKLLIVIIMAMAFSVLFNIVPFLTQVSSGFRIIIVTLVTSLIAAFVFPLGEQQ